MVQALPDVTVDAPNPDQPGGKAQPLQRWHSRSPILYQQPKLLIAYTNHLIDTLHFSDSYLQNHCQWNYCCHCLDGDRISLRVLWPQVLQDHPLPCWILHSE